MLFKKWKNEQITPQLPLSFYLELFEIGDLQAHELELVVIDLAGSVEALKKIIEILEKER